MFYPNISLSKLLLVFQTPTISAPVEIKATSEFNGGSTLRISN